jgi:hypothetical protein
MGCSLTLLGLVMLIVWLAPDTSTPPQAAVAQPDIQINASPTEKEAARKLFCGEVKASLALADPSKVPDHKVLDANLALAKQREDDRWALANQFNVTQDAASALMEDARVEVLDGKGRERCTHAELR